MAAILCRVCCVDPCKSMANCCSGICNCIGSCCQLVTNCCDWVSNLCNQPFSFCLFVSTVLNLIVIIYGIAALAQDTEDCGDPLLVLLILLFVCAIINALFSYYMYRAINADQNNPLFRAKPGNQPNNNVANNGDQSNQSIAQRAYDFFRYDIWMAFYIIFVLGLIGLLICSIVYADKCDSDFATALKVAAILMFVYLGVGIMILTYYVLLQTLAEMSQQPQYWLIPCCWPFLAVGCCVNYENNNRPPKPIPNNNNNNNNQPVVVTTAPNPNYYQQQNYQPPNNNNPNVVYAQPGVVVVHQQPNNRPPTQQQPANQNVVQYDAAGNAYIDGNAAVKKVAQNTDVIAKQGLKVLGWAAKKAVEIDAKANANNYNNRQNNARY